MGINIQYSYTEMVPLIQIEPHPDNENDHPEKQIKALSKIIKKDGQRHPIVVSKRSGKIVMGHGRLLAMQSLGWEEAAVDYQDFESEQQEIRVRNADNNIANYAEFQTDKFLANLEKIDLNLEDVNFEEYGLIDFELPQVEVTGECDEDEVPEVQPDPIAKRGDVWLLGKHRVMCGDSTMIDDVEKLMDGKKADMVFTDPPYGIGIDGQKKSVAKNPKHSRKGHDFKGWDNEIPSEDFFQILHSLNIPTVVFGGNYMTEYLPPSKGWIFWGKGQDGQLTSSDGELAWTNLNKPLRVVTCNRANIGKSVHPTQKPIDVVEFCLNYVGDAKSVIDLFLGSGSTLIACEKTNRKCYGMELDERYCDVIIKRWQDFTGKDAVLESTGESYNSIAGLNDMPARCL